MAFGVMNVVDIVTNDSATINQTIADRCPNGWNLNQLVDKPPYEVYLVWSKVCAVSDQPST
ncbi:MAG TPA: hypothetical protein VF609_05865 [Flavisolibacter sp.]|jgi:hypothetical protein